MAAVLSTGVYMQLMRLNTAMIIVTNISGGPPNTLELQLGFISTETLHLRSKAIGLWKGLREGRRLETAMLYRSCREDRPDKKRPI